MIFVPRRDCEAAREGSRSDQHVDRKLRIGVHEHAPANSDLGVHCHETLRVVGPKAIQPTLQGVRVIRIFSAALGNPPSDLSNRQHAQKTRIGWQSSEPACDMRIWSRATELGNDVGVEEIAAQNSISRT